MVRVAGINDHRTDGGRACEQGDGERHHGHAGPVGGFFHLVTGRFGGAGFGVEHADGADEQQHAAADLKRRDGNAEKMQQVSTDQRADGDDQKRRDRSDEDGSLLLLPRETLGEQNEKGNDTQRIDDRQQGDQGLDQIHGFGVVSARAPLSAPSPSSHRRA